MASTPKMLRSGSCPFDLYAASAETRRQAVMVKLADLTSKIGMSTEEAVDFIRLRQRYLDKKAVDWDNVVPAPGKLYQNYEELSEVSDKAQIKEVLDRLVIVQLNGGIGGLVGKSAKSSLPTLKKNGETITFLECKIQQVEHLNKTYGCNIPLVIMNSAASDQEAKKIVDKCSGLGVTFHTLLQSRFPMMYRDTLSPAAKSLTESEVCYPPGSGEVFTLMQRSGLLETLLKQGKEIMFINNVENLAGTIDTKILSHFGNSNFDFQLEVTDRIGTDTTGGMPIRYTMDNNVHVLEVAQIPPSFHSKFGVSNYKFWNTNNIWVKLPVLAKKLKEKPLDIDFTVKYREYKGKNLVQLETPASMAIHNFDRKSFLLVPRSRYKSIKTTSQLLQVQSDMYEIENGALIMNPKRLPATEPVVKLGEEFKYMSEYEKRFKSIPNVLELDHLTVSGDVYFGSNITLKGTVIIVADTGSRVDIPDGVTLENKIVAGNLLILDH